MDCILVSYERSVFMDLLCNLHCLQFLVSYDLQICYLSFFLHLQNDDTKKKNLPPENIFI